MKSSSGEDSHKLALPAIPGLTQPKASAPLKGQFRGISEHRLLECLTRLGRDVHIVAVTC